MNIQKYYFVCFFSILHVLNFYLNIIILYIFFCSLSIVFEIFLSLLLHVVSAGLSFINCYGCYCMASSQSVYLNY